MKFNKIIEDTSIKVALYKAFIFILILIIIALVIALTIVANYPKSLPYVIELTPEGAATYRSDALKLLNNWTPKKSTTYYFLREFLKNMRTSSIDKEITKSQLIKVYSVITSDAVAKVDLQLKEDNPLKQKYVRKIDIINISQISDASYQIDYRETKWENSKLKEDDKFRIIVVTKFFKPVTERQLENNPIGLYVTDFEISVIKDV